MNVFCQSQVKEGREIRNIHITAQSATEDGKPNEESVDMHASVTIIVPQVHIKLAIMKPHQNFLPLRCVMLSKSIRMNKGLRMIMSVIASAIAA